MKTNKLVVAIVVNFNGGELILETLQSISQSDYPNLRIIVVDNNSRDESVNLIEQRFPDLILIRNKRNLGFGTACNQGFERARIMQAAFVLFINSDATIEIESISVLRQLLEEKPQAGAIAPFIMYYDRRDLIWYGGGKVALWRGWVGHQLIRKQLSKLNLQSSKTEYLTGCIFLIRMEALQETDGFDPDYSLYSEDVDLSLRLQKSGWELWVTPETKGYHRVSASVGGELSPFKAYHRGRSTALLVKRQARWWSYPTLVSGGIIGGILVSLKLLISGRGTTVSAIWQGIWGGFLNLEIPDHYKLKD